MASLTDAIVTATRAHEGQTDKGGAPYILHPLRVMGSMSTDAERIVALLHDVVEDCGDEYPLSRIDEIFGGAIAHSIDCLTKRKGEAYLDYLARVAGDPIARKVKIADINDNCDVARLGREPTAEDHQRIQKYQGALAILALGPKDPAIPA